MRASFAIVQDQGRRKRQEDYAAFEASAAPRLDGAPDLVVLADGMGGHAGGDTASRTAVEAVLSVWRRTSSQSDARARLRSGLAAANEALDRAIGESPELEGMGCTLVALRPSADGLVWLSVGDSPMWRVRGREITRLNADHSRGRQLDTMAEVGLISAEEAASDRGRNQLAHALAGEPIEAVDEPWALEPLRAGDVITVASDGLDVLSPEEIAQICAKGADARATAQALLAAVLAKDAPNQDNVTIAVLKAENDVHGAAGAPNWLTILAAGLSLIGALLLAATLVVVGPKLFHHREPPPKVAPHVQPAVKPDVSPPHHAAKPHAPAKTPEHKAPKPKPAVKPTPKPEAKPTPKPEAAPKPDAKPATTPKPGAKPGQSAADKAAAADGVKTDETPVP